MARMTTYVGPKIQIQPNELDRYDNGKFAVEAKHDGYWAEVTTGDSGRIIRLVGRSGTKFEGSNVDGLIGLDLGVQNSVFAAELEAGTEASNKTHAKHGYRRIHIFDVICLLGHSTTSLAYEKRRELLELTFPTNMKRVLLTKRVTSDFKKFFKQIVSSGGEGVVIKRLGKAYKGQGADGKTNDWIRCKQFRYVDYVVVDVGKSEGGSPNLQVGLFIRGKLERVATIKSPPPNLDLRALIGKVIECKGAEIHDSGALRHGHYERTRDDKQPEECTLEAALNA